MTNIYKMNLHDTVVIAEPSHPKLIITRVPGGWMYSYSEGASVFVPFDIEFMGSSTR